MDADGRIIPIVEDDQGEGFKDLLDPDDLKEIYRKSLIKADKNQQAILSKMLNK